MNHVLKLARDENKKTQKSTVTNLSETRQRQKDRRLKLRLSALNSTRGIWGLRLRLELLLQELKWGYLKNGGRMRIQFQLRAIVFFFVQAAFFVNAEELCTLTECQDSQKIKITVYARRDYFHVNAPVLIFGHSDSHHEQ